MELKDLKSAWDKFSSKEANKHQLGEEAILDMLKKRTKNMIERIDRNIKIGFGILFTLVLFFILDDLIISPSISRQKGAEIPSWITIINLVNSIFILGTFIYFIIRYYGIQKNYGKAIDLRNTLKNMMRIINSYRKLFNVALFILLLSVGVNFISGMIEGFEITARNQGGEVQDLVVSQVALSITIGLIILFASITGLFVFFRWGFRKLYGNYIQKLKDTLHELDEIE